jgi:O-antigen/teichoic acid export membrane protein
MSDFQSAQESASGEEGLLARRSALAFVGLVGHNALLLLLLITLSRGLGQREAGIFFEGYAALRLLAVLAGLGLDVTMIRYVAHYRARHEDAHIASSLRMALVVAAVVSSVVGVLVAALAHQAADVFGSESLTFVLRVMALSLPLVVVEKVLIGAARGTGRMTAFTLIDQVLDSAVRLAAVGAALVFGYGLRGAAVAYAIAGLITLAAATVAAWPLIAGPAERIRGQIAEMLRFTGYQWAAVMAGVGLLWLDTLLLGIWRPPEDVAVYSIATRTVLFGMVFILPIGFAFQPVISRLYAVGDRAELHSLYSFATKWSTVTGCPPLIFLALFSTPVIVLLYGPSYAAGAWPLALLALGQIVNAITGPCGHIVTMTGRSDLVFQNSVAALVLNAALNVVLIPPYGMIGAGIAWASSIVAWNLFRLAQAWWLLRMHPFGGWVFPVTAALAAFTATAAFVRVGFGSSSAGVQVALGVTIPTLVYLAALVVLRIVNARDLLRTGSVLRLVRTMGR